MQASIADLAFENNLQRLSAMDLDAVSGGEGGAWTSTCGWTSGGSRPGQAAKWDCSDLVWDPSL
jgi:hypothetical protein